MPNLKVGLVEYVHKGHLFILIKIQKKRARPYLLAMSELGDRTRPLRFKISSSPEQGWKVHHDSILMVPGMLTLHLNYFKGVLKIWKTFHFSDMTENFYWKYGNECLFKNSGRYFLEKILVIWPNSKKFQNSSKHFKHLFHATRIRIVSQIEHLA